MGAVRCLLLDESLLLAEDESGNPHLLPEAVTLLRRLKHSKLRVGIRYQDNVSSEKAVLFGKMVTEYSFECLPWDESCIDAAVNRLLLAWSNCGGVCLYATSVKDEDLFLKLSDNGWKMILKSTGMGSTENKDMLCISKLEELLFTLCRCNKIVGRHDASNVMIGYIMKPSREEDFSKRGAFPICPTQNGLMFVPLTFELPLSRQIQEVDVILHKATDEIISINTALDFPKGILFSRGMQELERYVQDHPDCCIIDPLDSIYPLLDRLKIQEILLGLESVNKNHGHRIRGAHFLKVDHFHEPNLKDRLSEAQLSFPNIVKPQVACGVSDAHNMALVFKTEHFTDLHIPLPAIVQEYVDHGSVIYKFYVLGEKVFHAIKKSMPNADVLRLASEKNGSSPITFDSLKSLPSAEGDLASKHKNSEVSLDVGLVTDAAKWLRQLLDLTIFGFDVVIQEGSSDHVIVDVNYLPSFKEVPDSDAIPAFWDAIETSYKSRKKV